MAISHVYWHLVVKNGNFTCLPTSSSQEWQFHNAIDIKWSRMAISHCYWHLVVKNGNFTFLLTSSWSFISYKKQKSSVKEEQNLKQWAQIWQMNILWLMSSPPIQNCQRKERALCISIPSMRAHWNSQLMRKWQVMSSPPRNCQTKERALCIYIYHQWEPIQNSQLIRIYKKIPVQW